jgi:hypothetical protein
MLLERHTTPIKVSIEALTEEITTGLWPDRFSAPDLEMPRHCESPEPGDSVEHIFPAVSIRLKLSAFRPAKRIYW